MSSVSLVRSLGVGSEEPIYFLFSEVSQYDQIQRELDKEMIPHNSRQCRVATMTRLPLLGLASDLN